jgi:predicted alpha/beta-fold hydrolase
MLSGLCYPEDIAEEMDNIILEISDHGGHVGFLQKGKKATYAEERALQFFNEQIH